LLARRLVAAQQPRPAEPGFRRVLVLARRLLAALALAQVLWAPQPLALELLSAPISTSGRQLVARVWAPGLPPVQAEALEWLLMGVQALGRRPAQARVLQRVPEQWA
jgi:hypothetical protein